MSRAAGERADARPSRRLRGLLAEAGREAARCDESRQHAALLVAARVHGPGSSRPPGPATALAGEVGAALDELRRTERLLVAARSRVQSLADLLAHVEAVECAVEASAFRRLPT